MNAPSDFIPMIKPITDWRAVAMFFADVLVMERAEYADLVLQVIREKMNAQGDGR